MNFLEAIIMRFFLLLFCFPANHPTAQQIVERYVEAIGGQGALETIETMTYVRELDPGDERVSEPNVYYQKRSFSRWSPSSQPKSRLLLVGDRAWTAAGGTAGCLSRREPSGADGDIVSSLAPFLNYEKKGVGLALVETTRLQAAAYHHVKMTWPGGGQRELYFDAHTGLLARVEPDPNTTVWVSDYRSVGGLFLPHRSESRGTSSDGKTWHHVDTLIDVELRAPVEDCAFEAELT